MLTLENPTKTFGDCFCIIHIYINIILGVALYMYSYRTVTVQASSVRCMIALRRIQAIHPQSRRAPAAMQRCLITASRRTANANGDTEAGRADVWLTVFYFDKVPNGCQVSNAGTDVCVWCVCVCVWCACACVCAFACARAPARSLQLFPYTKQNKL